MQVVIQAGYLVQYDSLLSNAVVQIPRFIREMHR